MKSHELFMRKWNNMLICSERCVQGEIQFAKKVHVRKPHESFSRIRACDGSPKRKDIKLMRTISQEISQTMSQKSDGTHVKKPWQIHWTINHKSNKIRRKIDAQKRHARSMKNDAKMEPKWRPKAEANITCENHDVVIRNADIMWGNYEFVIRNADIIWKSHEIV